MCKKFFCFDCILPWNVCEEMHAKGSKEHENDILFEELVKAQRWTKCPGCHNHVERIKGCSFMRCRYLISHILIFGVSPCFYWPCERCFHFLIDPICILVLFFSFSASLCFSGCSRDVLTSLDALPRSIKLHQNSLPLIDPQSSFVVQGNIELPLFCFNLVCKVSIESKYI